MSCLAGSLRTSLSPGWHRVNGLSCGRRGGRRPRAGSSAQGPPLTRSSIWPVTHSVAAVSQGLTVVGARCCVRRAARRLTQSAGVLCRPRIRDSYCSRDVSDPPLRPGDRSRPRPGGSLTSRMPADLAVVSYAFPQRNSSAKRFRTRRNSVSSPRAHKPAEEPPIPCTRSRPCR